jgi:hypothetical protein
MRVQIVFFTDHEIRAAIQAAQIAWIVSVMIDAFAVGIDETDLPDTCCPLAKWGPDSEDDDDGGGHNALKNLVIVPPPRLAQHTPPAQEAN